MDIVKEVHKVKKVKLKLNKEQATTCSKYLGCSRLTFNYFLNLYNSDDTLNIISMCKVFHRDFVEQYPFIYDHNTNVFKEQINRLGKAISRNLKGISGKPNFKCRYDYTNSCTFSSVAISRNNLNDGNIHLTLDLRNIQFQCSKRDRKFIKRNKKKIKHITLIRDSSNEFYMAISFKMNQHIKQVEKPNKEIGIDMGIKTYVHTSNDEKYIFPDLKDDYDKLAKLQAQAATKTKKSKNSNKARIKVAKQYKYITNKRDHFMHTLSKKLIDENQIIYIESLDVKEMKEQANTCSKHLQIMPFGKFIDMIEYKADMYNSMVVKIDKYYPSTKTCSSCGSIKTMSLNDRTYECPKCGLIMDRDLNAALNIKNEGKRILSTVVATGCGGKSQV